MTNFDVVCVLYILSTFSYKYLNIFGINSYAKKAYDLQNDIVKLLLS